MDWFKDNSEFSKSCLDITPLLNNSLLLLNDFWEFSKDSLEELILLFALVRLCSFGTTLILAIRSPFSIISPSSTKITSTIPVTWGFSSISSSGFNLPVATTLVFRDL